MTSGHRPLATALVSRLGVINALQLQISHFEHFLATLGNRRGHGGQKQEAEDFIVRTVLRLRPKVEKLVTSGGSVVGDSHIVLFFAVRHKKTRYKCNIRKCCGYDEEVVRLATR